jgi:hypothetical protein
MKRKPHRSQLQREQDKATISRLILQGKTQQEIANYLELDRSLISREIKAIRQEWKQSGLRDFDEERGQKLAELELIKIELWQAWDESKTAQESTAVEKISMAGSASGSSSLNSARTKYLVKKQTKPGDLSYMSGIVNCIKEQSKLLALYPEEATGGQSITLTDGQLGVIGQLMGERRADIN